MLLNLSLPLAHEQYFSLFYGPTVVAKLQINTQPFKLALLSHFAADVQQPANTYMGLSVYHQLALALSHHWQFYVVGLWLEF